MAINRSGLSYSSRDSASGGADQLSAGQGCNPAALSVLKAVADSWNGVTQYRMVKALQPSC